MRKTLKLTLGAALLLAAAAFALPVAANAAAAAADLPIEKDAQGVAIHGYDAVAYFTAGKPVAGKAEFKTQWQGAEWRFASVEDRDLFVKEPEKYAPQYGGHCAYGMALGHLAPSDPKAWKVVDGKLYLNYSKDVQGLWQKDPAGFIPKADKNWAAQAPKP
jgi:YHS domain-containing protein